MILNPGEGMKTALKVIGIAMGVLLLAVIIIAAAVPLWFPVTRLKPPLLNR